MGGESAGRGSQRGGWARLGLISREWQSLGLQVVMVVVFDVVDFVSVCWSWWLGDGGGPVADGLAQGLARGQAHAANTNLHS